MCEIGEKLEFMKMAKSILRIWPSWLSNGLARQGTLQPILHHSRMAMA